MIMVEAWSVSLVLCGLLFFQGLYLFLKHYLVRRLCEPVVRAREHKTTRGVSNGTNGSLSVKEAQYSEVLSDAAVAKIAEWVKGGVLGVIASVAAVVVLWQARDDFVYGRSWVLVPYAHCVIGYFIVDSYVLYDCISLKHRNLTFPQRLLILCKAKWAFILHHLAVLFILYPICIGRQWRNDNGDFYIGTFLIRELMHPFAALHFVLQLLNMKDTKLYLYNGIMLVVSFFLTRIVSTPVCILIYAAQHHNWNVWAALCGMRSYCHIAVLLEFLLQLYWFIGIMRKGLGVLKRKTN